MRKRTVTSTYVYAVAKVQRRRLEVAPPCLNRHVVVTSLASRARHLGLSYELMCVLVLLLSLLLILSLFDILHGMQLLPQLILHLIFATLAKILIYTVNWGYIGQFLSF